MEEVVRKFTTFNDSLFGEDNGYKELCAATKGVDKVILVEEGMPKVECTVRYESDDRYEIIFKHKLIKYSVLSFINLESFAYLRTDVYCPKFYRRGVKFHITDVNGKFLAKGVCEKQKIIGNWMYDMIIDQDAYKTFMLIQAGFGLLVVSLTAPFYDGKIATKVQTVIEAKRYYESYRS